MISWRKRSFISSFFGGAQASPSKGFPLLAYQWHGNKFLASGRQGSFAPVSVRFRFRGCVEKGSESTRLNRRYDEEANATIEDAYSAQRGHTIPASHSRISNVRTRTRDFGSRSREKTRRRRASSECSHQLSLERNTTLFFSRHQSCPEPDSGAERERKREKSLLEFASDMGARKRSLRRKNNLRRMAERAILTSST